MNSESTPTQSFARGFGDANAFSIVRDSLDELVGRTRLRWPQSSYALADFAGDLGALLRETPPHELASRLAELQLEELYLARASAAGDAGATRHLRREYASVVATALSHQAPAHIALDDIEQVVWMRLLVADGDRRPKLERYRGEGRLASWIRVVAIRTRADLLRSRKPVGEAVDPMELQWEELGAASQTPELSYLKASYRGRFRSAFAEAVAELDAGSRNLLRQKHIFGLTLAEMANLHGVHVATIKRRLAQCRTQLIEGTGRRVCGDAPQAEALASVLRMVRSQVEVSLARYLDEAQTQPSTE